MDFLPVAVAPAPREPVALTDVTGTGEAGHGHQRPGGALGGIPLLGGQPAGDRLGLAPGAVAVAAGVAHQQLDGLATQRRAVGGARAVVLRGRVGVGDQFAGHVIKPHLLVGGGQQPVRGLVAGPAAVAVRPGGQRFPQPVLGTHLRLAGQRQGVKAVGLAGPLPGLAARVASHTALVVGPVFQHAGGHREALTARFQQEVTGVGGAPVVGHGGPGPIGEGAVAELEAAQPLDGRFHVALNAGALLVVEGDQPRQIELRQGRRHGLLHAAVGIAEQVLQAALQAHGRQAAYGQPALVGAGQTVGAVPLRPGLAGGQQAPGVTDGGRVGGAHRQVHGFAGAVTLAVMLVGTGGHGHRGGAGTLVGFQAQFGDPFAAVLEVQFGALLVRPVA